MKRDLSSSGRNVSAVSLIIDRNGLGPALRFLRLRREWRQCHLAERAGVTRAMLSAYENGKRLPSVRTLARLLDALGADFRHLQAALELTQENRGLASES